MKDEEQLYSRWLTYRKQIPPSDTFSKDVMTAIDRAAAQQTPVTTSDLPWFLHHPLARWITASGLVLLGLFRVLYITGSLLRANPVMP